MDNRPRRGTHLPILIKLLAMTEGVVLELGCGFYSTIFLHWACFPNRKLITYESKPEWIQFAQQFENDYHKVQFVNHWNDVDLSIPCSIAFVDHEAGYGRVRADEAMRITNAEYIVCHDTENNVDHKYKFSRLNRLFKYRVKFTSAGTPYTSIYSNHDLKELDDFIHNNLNSK